MLNVECHKVESVTPGTCVCIAVESVTLGACVCIAVAGNCDTALCENGATCNNGVNSYTCLCDVGYTGILCDKGRSAT